MPARKRFTLALLLIPVAAGLVLRAGPDPAPPAKPPTAFECRWAAGPITIDGVADEPAWKNAAVIDHFYLPWLGDKARPARTATRAKLLWDREYLYFFADMDDTDLCAQVRDHDGMLWFDDVFELFFKPAADKPGYYEFQVNAAGAVLDMLLPRRGAGGYHRFKGDGDFHVEAKVKLRGTLNNWTDRDQGWSVEGRIPWTDFARTGGRPEPGEHWKFALCRYDYSVDFEGPETSTCAPLTKSDFHRHEDYATLTFVGPDARSEGPVGREKFVPLTTAHVAGSPDPPPPYRAVRVYPKYTPNFPIFVVHQPGSDRLLVITEDSPYGPTQLYRIADSPDAAKSEKLLEFDDVTYSLAFHPKFAENGFFYVGHATKRADGVKVMRITRYTMQPRPPYALDPKSATVIIEWVSDGHNGGAMAFGHDGMMYVTTGDGTSDSDLNVVGQDMTKLLSKVLRIDVDHPEPGKAYSVPKDNPFVNTPNVRPETWAYGFRNPWRMTVDRETGHLWVGQNGQDLWEQVYLVRRGENYGWSVFEGSHPFYPNRKLGPTPHVMPTVEHHHSEARSLTGGIVYYGAKYPELHGAYIYGDYSTGRVWAVKHDGTKIVWHKELARTSRAITSFGTDSKGEILITDHRGSGQGGLYTLEPTPKDRPGPPFPRRLSDSGLFRSVKGHDTEPALIPYSVNAPLWSDGAYKERYLALPGTDPKIEFTSSRGWNFPDGTVLVKSFALNTEAGSRRWVETRFLVKQEGEWAGYSYAWDDAQTDAELVEAGGRDRTFSVRGPDGVRQQVWHYPSRAECLVCHSRAANFVLGLSELQMNKDHDYGGVRANQLRTLEHLGLFRVNPWEELKEAIREEAKAKGLHGKAADEYVERQTATRDQRPPVTESRLLPRTPARSRKLADPSDATADRGARARSYLHANCSQCHVEAGGGNAKIDLEFTTSADKMNIFGVKPQHHTFGLPDARLIAPGHPERSVLLHRIGHRGEGHMPPLATNAVDHEAVRLLRDWITRMPPKAE